MRKDTDNLFDFYSIQQEFPLLNLDDFFHYVPQSYCVRMRLWYPAQWHTCVIPNAQEAEAGGWEVQSRHEQVHESCLKTKYKKDGESNSVV